MGAGALSKLFNIHVGMDSKVAQNWGRALFSTFPSLLLLLLFFFFVSKYSLSMIYLLIKALYLLNA